LYHVGVEINISSLGDGHYEVIAENQTDGRLDLSSDNALQDLLRSRGLAEKQIANILEELQPPPRKIRVIVNP
jgi:hypothetical protein